jgi:hypothetical protein
VSAAEGFRRATAASAQCIAMGCVNVVVDRAAALGDRGLADDDMW